MNAPKVEPEVLLAMKLERDIRSDAAKAELRFLGAIREALASGRVAVAADRVAARIRTLEELSWTPPARQPSVRPQPADLDELLDMLEGKEGKELFNDGGKK